MDYTSNTSLLYAILAVLLAALLLGLFFSRPLPPPEMEATASGPAEPVAEPRAQLTALPPHAKSGPSPGLAPLPEDDSPALTFLAESNADYLQLLQWLQEQQLLERSLAVLPQLRSLKIRLRESELQRLLQDNERISYGTDIRLYLPERPEERPEWDGYAGLAFGRRYLEFLGVDSSNPERGAGCVVALLDTPLANHTSLNSSNIVTQDWFGLLASAEELDRSHGTAVASILAGENGISPGVNLLSLPVVGADGSCSAFELATAIVTAVDSGADIISISLAAAEGNAVLAAAVRYAGENQVLLVAAAGNDGGERVAYPAAYPGVLAVGAVNAAGEHAGFSNQGPAIALAAPGVGLQAAAGEDGWEYFSGTSAAVPCVVGVLANFLSANPGIAAPDAVQLLLATSDDTGQAGVDDYTGHGVVNARRLDNWRTPGIYDAAAAGHFLLQNSNRDGNIHLQVSAQNTGTETLPELLLHTAIADAVSKELFVNVPPGEVVSIIISVPADSVRASGSVVVSSWVETPGVEDAQRRNQLKRSSLSLNGSK